MNEYTNIPTAAGVATPSQRLSFVHKSNGQVLITDKLYFFIVG